MLIRLYNHPSKHNRRVADEVINIEGLPDDIFFGKITGFYHFEEADDEGNIKKEYRKEVGIKDPWEPDVAENYPKEVIAKYGKKMEYWTKVDRQVLGPNVCYALRVDYSRTPGEQVWKRIEAILESSTPRGGVEPSPIVVGDESGWTIGVDDIPNVKILSSVEERIEKQKEATATLVEKMKSIKA